MKRLAVALATLLIPSFAIANQDPPKIAGECLIVIDGHTEKNGPCRIMLFPGGGFQTGGEKRGEAFAMIDIDPEHKGSAYWNGVEHASHAQDELGAVTRDGGCWSNDRARICAWRPGTRPPGT